VTPICEHQTEPMNTVLFLVFKQVVHMDTTAFQGVQEGKGEGKAVHVLN